MVDVDNKRSIEVGGSLVGIGEHSVREIESEFGPFPETRYVETGGGGRHLYFAYGPGCGGNRTNIRPGIDVRGEGGFVIAPPSIHLSGYPYTWVNREILPDPAPTWIVELAAGNPQKLDAIGEDDQVVEGSRNSYLHQLGAKFRRENGFSEFQLVGLLMAHNYKQCNPPLDLDEVQRIAGNCAKYDYTPPVDLSEWAKANEPPPIPEGGDLAVSLYDLILNPPDPPEPLVNGVMSVGTGVLMAGQPNVGKSWFVMDMALAIVSGQPWLGYYETTAGGVLMIDEEGTEYGQYERFQMLLDGRGHLSAVGLPLHLSIGTGLRLDNDVGITRIRRMLERYKPRLVVIDSLVRMHNGEENNSGQMAKFFETTKGLMKLYDTTFLFTHHVRKPSLDSLDPGDLIRGTTEIRAWPDTIFVLAPGDDNQEVVVHHVKSRYSRRADPFKVRMQIDEDSGTARLARTETISEGSATVHASHSKILRVISDLCDSGMEPGVADIAVAVGLTSRTVRDYLTRLTTAGAVEAIARMGITVYRIKGA